MADDIAIRVQNVKKDFHLPHHKSNSIKQSIVQAFKKKDKDVDTFHALRGISFDIKRGEFFGILGRNGSGKSTLLKIISEIYRPTSGRVSHTGTLVSFIELGVGFKAELSGRENVYLNGALLGFSKEEIDERYDEIVKFAELEEFMEQKIKNYSSGMKVRLAFAVAIQANSDILVLDEVLAVGDASFQRKCYDYFKSLKDNQKKTVVFVSHSMGAVREYCDRAVLIESGVVTFAGNAEDTAIEYLKLFNKDQYKKEMAAKTSKERGDSNRWGDESLTLQSIESKISKNTVDITAVIQNNIEKAKDVVVAIDIFDKNKRLVGGTESFRVSKQTIDFIKDETKEVKFKLKNIFGGGLYYVYVAVKSRDNMTVYDFMKDAVRFENAYEIEEYFPIVLPAEIEITPRKQ